MTASNVNDSTRYESSDKFISGGFDAETSIGFKLISFSYISRVTY